MLRLAGFAVLALALVCFAGVQASEQGKEVTLKGKVTCGKCDLQIKELVDAKKCHTVVVVKEKEKDVVYFFDLPASKKNHGAVCTNPTDGTVTGVVSKEGDKNIITVSKVELSKK